MTNTMTAADQTIIAKAESYVSLEHQAGRKAIFARELAGPSADFRQRRLFELAMLREEMRIEGFSDGDLFRQVSDRLQHFSDKEGQ